MCLIRFLANVAAYFAVVFATVMLLQGDLDFENALKSTLGPGGLCGMLVALWLSPGKQPVSSQHRA